MKAYVSVDLEGMPLIVSREHTLLKGYLFGEARRIATRLTLAVVEELHKHGFDEVYIADSHGDMINLEVEALPEYVYLIRGYPRPLSMVVYIEKTDAAVFLGYHSKAGTGKSNFDHTMSSAKIDYLKINGVEASEFLLNAYAAGYYNVPVILVAGDKALIENDVSKYTPWAEKIALKESISRFASISPSLVRVEHELAKAVERACMKLKSGDVKVLTPPSPVEVEVRFLGTEQADIAELLPTAKRVDGKTIRYVAKDIIEAYRVFELLIHAAPGLYPYE